MIIGCAIFLYFFYIRCKNCIKILTYNRKKCILTLDEQIFCFKTNQMDDVEAVEEECLKSKMAEKYESSTTMTVYQIEKLRKYTRYWFLMLVVKKEVI